MECRENKDREYKITDRQVANLREDVSRIYRQVELINRREFKTDTGEHRLDIIKAYALKIDDVLKNI